jgi:GLPGLI family protein
MLRYIVAFLFLNLSYGQNSALFSVEYLYQNDYYTNKQFLYGNSINSVYVTTPLNQKNEEAKYTVNGSEYTLSPNDIKLDQSLYFKSNIENTVYGVQSLDFKNRFVVLDSTIIFNWVLVNDTRLIAGVICKGATVNFRGRDYLAFYNENIPINAGPYKFSGLPGLIMSLESKSGTEFHRWTVVSFKSDLDSVPFKYDLLNEMEFTKVSLYDYVKLCDSQAAELFKALRSRSDDTDATLTSSVTVRSGIERTYEWENEPDDKTKK